MIDPYKELREIEEAQAIMNTAKRKAKKAAKKKKLLDMVEEYSTTRVTGNISWVPKHSSGHERWKGMVQGKEAFRIEMWVHKYHLKVLKEEFKAEAKPITERSFDFVAKKAEKIIENYLKTLKEKK